MELPQILTRPRYAGGRNLLLSLTPGPIAEGDTTQGVDGYGWAFWVDSGGVIRYQRAGDAPLSPDAPTPAFMAGVDGRGLYRIGAGFDQNARRVLALSTRDSVTVSWLIPGPVDTENRLTFAGCDALVWWDGLMRDYRAGEPTDVGIYYLSPDRMRLCYRLQLEGYAVERTLATLSEPCSLDTIARSGLKVAFYLSPKGSKNGRGLVSENYPARGRDGLSLSAALVGGVHFEVIVQRDDIREQLNVSGALSGGNYYESIILRDPNGENIGVSAQLLAGSYFAVILSRDPTSESVAASVSFQAGSYANVVNDAGGYGDGVSVSAALLGGSYI